MNLWDYLNARGERRAARYALLSAGDRRHEFRVLMMIVVGLIGILLTITIGLFLTSRPGFSLPNWAENVLISIATACALKLGDCISALVALATGRTVADLGNRLGDSTPNARTPRSAAEGAGEVAGAAAERAEEIAEGAAP